MAAARRARPDPGRAHVPARAHADGWIEIEGERRSVEDWYGSRDHSWGVRPGTGGYEPVTGPPRQAHAEFLRAFLFFNTHAVGGVVDVTQGAGGFQRSFGTVQWPAGSGRPHVAVTRAELDISYLDGMSPCRHREPGLRARVVRREHRDG